MTADPAELLVDGPWRHRFVTANGAQFHLAEAGSGPLVVLLHGFPQFWWAWRNQLPPLAAAGYRVCALDLRGCGASDRPPRGYDTRSLTRDVAGVVRALGESEAVVAGHGWGGWVAWAMPALEPEVTRAVAVLGMAHPLTLRAALLRPGQLRLLAGLAAARVPVLPARRLRRSGVGALVRRGWGEGSPDAADLALYSRALLLPSAAHTAMQYPRTLTALSGRRAGHGGHTSSRHLVRALARPVTVPVLQLHGSRDPWVRPATAAASRVRVEGALTARVLPGAGHFLPEEAPTAVTAALLEWLAGTTLRPAESPARRSAEPQQ